MEQFRHCPICTEVPRKEIYQCQAGHVICDSCIYKIKDARCPQCRIPLENSKIRCRVLEEILNSQDFECKFKDEGCEHVMKRGDITTHTNSCDYNPELYPLCKNLGFTNCKYKGSFSKTEVISHFRVVHGVTHTLDEDLTTRISRKRIMELCNGKRKSDSSKIPTSRLLYLVSKNDREYPSLFLVYGRINKPGGSFSVVCFKVWESRLHPDYFKTWEVEFTLKKKISDVLPIPTATDPFTIRWTHSVYCAREASNILKECPVSIARRLLRESRFGENNDEELVVEIVIKPVL